MKNISYIIVLTWISMIFWVFYLTVQNDREKREMVALETARAFFDQILITRAWNALHGGVYVPVTSETKPNPYLEDDKRDVMTGEGLQLTRINPAYMTRQISEISAKGTGVQFHITSLNPIRPGNAPRPWEKAWLALFPQGIKEKYAFVVENETIVFRYMAPLKTDAACLKCHAKQGYKVGDVRGGISVTLPFVPSEHYVFYFLGYGFAAVVGAFIILVGGRLLEKQQQELISANAVLDDKNRKLKTALDEVKTLGGLIPICSHCKKIRDDKGYWNQIESYIQKHSDAEFSHSICKDCAGILYPDFKLYDEDAG